MNDKLFKKLMVSLILEYRLSLDTIGELFKVNKEDLYVKLINGRNPEIKNAMIYILDYESKDKDLIDQKEARKNATVFLIRYMRAKDENEKINLINSLNNIDDIKRIANKNDIDRTDEEKVKIIKYRYKYCLPKEYIEYVFGVPSSTQSGREKQVDQKLYKKLIALNNYNIENINKYNYAGKNVK